MAFRLALVFCLALWPLTTLALTFERYHTQEEIDSYMRELAARHPSLVRVHHMGYSQRGRPVHLAVVSKRDPDTVPALYMNGTHHGNEKSSTEAVVGLLKYLVENRDDPTVDELLQGYAVYVQPIVNPDGHAIGVRSDSFGRDPNRDYSFADRPEQDSFKVPTVRLVKELTDRVRFRAAAAFHSGMEAVLWPFCHTPARAPDTDLFYTLSKATAEAMGMTRYVQSYYDYPTRGEFIDYVYQTHGTLAVTVEVSNEPTPPASRLAAVVRRAVAGGMVFMLSVMDHDRGALVIQRAPGGEPTLASAAELRAE